MRRHREMVEEGAQEGLEHRQGGRLPVEELVASTELQQVVTVVLQLTIMILYSCNVPIDDKDEATKFRR